MTMCSMLAGATLLLGSQLALAQATLGELLEQGGKRLDKAEVQALLVGATLAGPTTTGGDVRLEVKADGSLSGNMRTIRSFGEPEVGAPCRDSPRFRGGRPKGALHLAYCCS